MFFRLLSVLVLSLSITGCSVFMAANHADHKDLEVAKKGFPRDMVLTEFGQPLVTESNADGDKVDLFKFKQGYGKGNKALRATFHGVADVFTLGLWEIVGTPTEAVFSGHEVVMKVTYDKQEMVKDVVYLKGEDDKNKSELRNVTEVKKEEIKAAPPTTNFNGGSVNSK